MNNDNYRMFSMLIPLWMYDMMLKIKYDSGNKDDLSKIVRKALIVYFKSRKLKIPENI